MLPQVKRQMGHFFSDAACVASLIGIWPRFIEPKLLAKTSLHFPINGLPSALEGLKILHFSDLHLHPQVPHSFLKKLRRKIESFQPDLIAFTGDFLCCSVLADPDRLLAFLSSLKAPLGCYAVLGNHDYAQFVSVNREGNYDVIPKTKSSFVAKGLQRLIQSRRPTGVVTSRASQVEWHKGLMDLLSKTSFQVLHNDTVTIPVKGTYLNVTGMGEHMLGKADPQKAFVSCQSSYPCLVLAHNPDVMPYLKDYPGDLLLCGHTHGAEIYLPWLWRKFTLIENPELKRGLVKWGNKWVYTTRGIGSTEPFRLFSMPELLCLTLTTCSKSYHASDDANSY